MPVDGVQVVAESETAKSPTILIVEDEALIAANIEEVLEESGFRVAGVAGSALEALSIADEQRPRLALKGQSPMTLSHPPILPQHVTLFRGLLV